MLGSTFTKNCIDGAVHSGRKKMTDEAATAKARTFKAKEACISLVITYQM